MGTPSVDPSPKVAAEPPRRDQRVRPPDLIYGLDERPPLPHLILLGAQHVAVICPYLVFIALIAQAAGASSAVASHAGGAGHDRYCAGYGAASASAGSGGVRIPSAAGGFGNLLRSDS